MKVLSRRNNHPMNIKAFIKIVNSSITTVDEYANRLLENPETCCDADIKIIENSIEMTKDLINIGIDEYDDKRIHTTVLSSWTSGIIELSKKINTLKKIRSKGDKDSL